MVDFKKFEIGRIGHLFMVVLGLSLAVNSQNAGSGGDFFTSEEKVAIDKLRPLVTDFLTLDYMKTDLYLLRWLKAAKFDVLGAVELMRKSNTWRKDNKIDGLLSENFEGHKRYLPYNIDGFDRAGNPIFQVQTGKWQIRKYVLAGKRDLVVRFYWQLSEKMEQKVFETAQSTGKNISDFYFLSDLDGFSVAEQGCLGCFPVFIDIARTFDPHHPHFIKNAIFINSPRIFSPLLNLMKAVVAGPTLQIIHDYGHSKAEWQPKILKDIEPDQLPPSFGGTKSL